jgi:D-alanine-D-alanine ligase-like ATP-grasp enzyme
MRIDIVLRGTDGVPCLLEVSTVPSMTEASALPVTLAAMGFRLDQFYAHMISEATEARL